MFWGVDFNFDFTLPRLHCERAAALTSEPAIGSNKWTETPDFARGGRLFARFDEDSKAPSDWRRSRFSLRDVSSDAE